MFPLGGGYNPSDNDVEPSVEVTEETTIEQLLGISLDFSPPLQDTHTPPPPSRLPLMVPVKKSRLSLKDKDEKTKERILRNRAAAQESRDRKNRYINELEQLHGSLTQENSHLTQRARTLESENEQLLVQIASIKACLDPNHAEAVQSDSGIQPSLFPSPMHFPSEFLPLSDTTAESSLSVQPSYAEAPLDDLMTEWMGDQSAGASSDQPNRQ